MSRRTRHITRERATPRRFPHIRPKFVREWEHVDMLWLLVLGWLTIALVVSPVCGRVLASRAGRDVMSSETGSTSEVASR